jgi:hypothetical protein
METYKSFQEECDILTALWLSEYSYPVYKSCIFSDVAQKHSIVLSIKIHLKFIVVCIMDFIVIWDEFYFMV